ncbi:MAG: single-stranded DNA-binding protein [Deltaproteobacteria bacterium]|nr:single-stranded DNA-binding protein [Deltaproteobacteria bacterium]
MDGLNRTQLIGHVGQDPELKVTSNGHSMMKLSVATNESWRDKDNNLQERTEWHRVTVFGKQAESLSRFVRKGWKVFVEARLEHSSYEKDGQKLHQTDLVASRVLALGPPRGTADDGVPYVAPRSQSNGAFSSAPARPLQSDIPF